MQRLDIEISCLNLKDEDTPQKIYLPQRFKNIEDIKRRYTSL